MRILYLVQNFATPEDPSGIRHYTHARAMARRGHDVTVLAAYRLSKGGKEIQAGTSSHDERMEGFRVTRVHVLPVRHGLLGRLSSYLSFMSRSIWVGARFSGRFDVVLASSPPLFVGVSGVILAAMKRARFVLEVRDLWPASAVALGFLRNSALIWASGCLERWLYRRARAIVCLTEGIANEIKMYRSVSERVYVVRNGVDVELFEQDTLEVSGQLRRDYPNHLIAMYAGAQGVNNALDVLIDAAGQLRDEAIQFVLLGTGSQTDSLRERCMQEELANVTFIGTQPRKDVPKLLLCADVLLWPVYLRDATPKLLQLKRGVVPNKLYDYLATGRPIVTSVPKDGEAARILRQYGFPTFASSTGSDFAESLRAVKANTPDDMARDTIAQRVRREFCREEQAAKLMTILEDLVRPTVHR